MSAEKFQSYRTRSKNDKSLKWFSSHCPLFKRGPLKWSQSQCCLVLMFNHSRALKAFCYYKPLTLVCPLPIPKPLPGAPELTVQSIFYNPSLYMHISCVLKVRATCTALWCMCTMVIYYRLDNNNEDGDYCWNVFFKKALTSFLKLPKILTNI